MYKQNKIALLLLLLLATVVYFFTTIENSTTQTSYKDKIIRLHIIANSNSEEDQNLKLKVRDEIIKSLNERLLKSKNIEESRDIVTTHLEQIEETARKVVTENGYIYPVDARLGKTWIPEKDYKNLTLPAGEYEALNVVIGEGKGHNWWCVLFPPLCLIDSKEGEVDDALKALSENLTEEEYQLLAQEIEEDESILCLKFKTLEKAEELKASIKKFIMSINKSTASIY